MYIQIDEIAFVYFKNEFFSYKNDTFTQLLSMCYAYNDKLILRAFIKNFFEKVLHGISHFITL